MRKSSKFHALRQAQSSILERLSLGNRATYFTFFGSYDSDRRSVRVRSVRVWPMSEVGSKPDLTSLKCDFRYPPESGLKSDIAPCLLSANFGSAQLSGQNKKPPKGGSIQI